MIYCNVCPKIIIYVIARKFYCTQTAPQCKIMSSSPFMKYYAELIVQQRKK